MLTYNQIYIHLYSDVQGISFYLSVYTRIAAVLGLTDRLLETHSLNNNFVEKIYIQFMKYAYVITYHESTSA